MFPTHRFTCKFCKVETGIISRLEWICASNDLVPFWKEFQASVFCNLIHFGDLTNPKLNLMLYMHCYKMINDIIVVIYGLFALFIELSLVI